MSMYGITYPLFIVILSEAKNPVTRESAYLL
jgi:hypothetical protein